MPEIIPAFRQPLEAVLRCGCCRCLAGCLAVLPGVRLLTLLLPVRLLSAGNSAGSSTCPAACLPVCLPAALSFLTPAAASLRTWIALPPPQPPRCWRACWQCPPSTAAEVGGECYIGACHAPPRCLPRENHRVPPLSANQNLTPSRLPLNFPQAPGATGRARRSSKPWRGRPWVSLSQQSLPLT